jgi:hypothetical protein
LHLDAILALALARFATSPFDVKAEATRFVAPYLALWEIGEELANRIEDFGVRRRVGTRCPPDGALINLDDLVEVL